MAGPRRDEFLFAAEHEPYGPASGEHKVPDDVLYDHLLFRAETASQTGLYDADGLHREPEQRCEHAPDVEGHLRRGSQHETLVLVEPPDRDVRLDRRVLHLLDFEGRLEDVVGPPKAASISASLTVWPSM